ncbi:MAG: LLM class flavin-dependent oxidoreductase [Chloroflexi bacterium]|nr:LLM class flavin-dependent oxidoreductase [Chloroflexota bacterium]
MKFGLIYDLRNPTQFYQPENHLYNEFLDECQMMDELGWDCIWICEHHYDPDTPWVPSALTLAAAVAARTKRIKIGTGIIVLPQHNPVRVAEAATVLDYVSNGRFRLGVANGYRVSEYRADNISRKERVPRLLEGIEIIQKCWTEDKFSYDGQFWKITDMQFAPKPISKPHPPIYIAGGGGPDQNTAQRAGRLGCHVFPGPSREFGIAYHKALRENGFDPRQFEFAASSGHLWISEDPEKDWQEIKKYVDVRTEWYHKEHVASGQAMEDTSTFQSRQQRGKTTFVDISGAIKHVERVIKDVPQLTEMAFWAGYPGMPLSQSRKSLEMFAKKVMPKFHQ